MKPKRRILIIDADPDRASMLTFALKTRGRFQIETADTYQSALSLDGGWPEVIVGEASFPRMAKLLLDLHKRYPFAPQLVLALAYPEWDFEDLIADSFLRGGSFSNRELHDRIRELALRKRGPRKRVVSALPETAARPAWRRLA